MSSLGLPIHIKYIYGTQEIPILHELFLPHLYIFAMQLYKLCHE